MDSFDGADDVSSFLHFPGDVRHLGVVVFHFNSLSPTCFSSQKSFSHDEIQGIIKDSVDSCLASAMYAHGKVMRHQHFFGALCVST